MISIPQAADPDADVWASDAGPLRGARWGAGDVFCIGGSLAAPHYQQALDEVLKGRTALVIAHRLSTIRNADKIIALEEGRIRKVGDHHELLARGGLYSQLYRRQLELAASGAEEA